MLRCSIQLYVYKQFMRILLDFLVIANEQCRQFSIVRKISVGNLRRFDYFGLQTDPLIF